MAGWGFIGVRRRVAVVVALTAAIAGLTGLQAAGSTLDDPPVPPSPPQVTATSNGVEIVNCIDQPLCPDSAVAGEPVVVTIKATSPGVVTQRYTPIPSRRTCLARTSV